MTKTTDTTPIHERAMLVKLSVSAWTARKFDRKVTEEVNRQHGANDDVGRYNKHLLGGKDHAKSHAAVVSAAKAMRTTVYEQTLPWADEGWRLLPTANYEKFTDALRAARTRYDDAVEAFVREYPELRENARKLLNGMFRDEDYPDADSIAGRFSCTVDFSPVPAQGDFRLDLPADQIERLEGSAADRVKRAVGEAMQGAWERLHKVVAHARERLGDPDAIFRDTLIGNISELTDILSRLNVTGDDQLETMRKRVERDLSKLQPDVLRKNKTARAQAANKAQKILESMSAFYGGDDAKKS